MIVCRYAQRITNLRAIESGTMPGEQAIRLPFDLSWIYKLHFYTEITG